MRARALTFSFLTSLSVLRQEHRFPNTLFLCSRTFSFALGPPRPPTLLFLFLSLSSPSQNLTLFLYVSCSGNGGWFNLYFEPGSPPRIGFARFALMFRQNELYKRKHTPKRITFDVTNRIWRTIQLCIRKRQATATIAKRRVTKRCSSCFLRQLDERSSHGSNPKDGRSFEKWTEGSHCKHSPSPPPPSRKAIANRTNRREKNCRYSQTRGPLPPLSTNLYRDEANKRVDEYCANHLEDSLLSLSLSLSDILRSRIVFNKDW